MQGPVSKHHQWGPLLYSDLDLLDPLLLASPCKEAPHKDAPGQRGDLKPEQAGSTSFQGFLALNKVIEEGDWILAALPL